MRPLLIGSALLLLSSFAQAQAEFRLPALAAAAPLSDAKPRRIDRLQVDGNTVLDAATLNAVAAPWLGRELDEAQIEALRQALSRAYIERGFVNSGLLLAAAQDQAGALRLRAIEGRLSRIELRGLDGVNPEHVRARLRGSEAEVLNVDRLRERFQLLLADPLFKRVQARLLPGEQAGEAVLDIEVERARPWQLSAMLHNQRPVSVGEWAAGLRGQLSNLSGQGDQLDATLLVPVEGKGSSQGQLGLQWKLPLTALGLARTQLSVGAEHSDAAVIEEPVRALDIESRVRSLDLGLAQTLIDVPAHRLQIGLQQVWRRQHSSLLGEPFSFTAGLADGRLRESLTRFWQEAQWRSEQQAVALRSSISLARSNVQAEVGLPPGVEPAPAKRALFWTGQAQWVRKLDDDGLQGTARVSAQITRDRLLALDGLSAGGLRSVRGHRENALVRDEGWVANLELEQSFAPRFEAWPAGLRLALTGFYDHARLRNRTQPWASISAIGLSLTAHWQGWNLELAAAKRLQEHGGGNGHSAWQDQGLHLLVAHRW